MHRAETPADWRIEFLAGILPEARAVMSDEQFSAIYFALRCSSTTAFPKSRLADLGLALGNSGRMNKCSADCAPANFFNAVMRFYTKDMETAIY